MRKGVTRAVGGGQQGALDASRRSAVQSGLRAAVFDSELAAERGLELAGLVAVGRVRGDGLEFGANGRALIGHQPSEDGPVEERCWLRVLQPNDPDAYYADRELVPGDLLEDVHRAKIVITNYHAFQRRERIELSAGGRSLLQGRGGKELDTLETKGQMLQRVMPDLMGMKNIVVLNDEAHHCYREKPKDPDDEELKGDERKEAEKNR